MLPGRETLIEFGIASYAAPENPALQSGKFDLLVGDRIVGVERGFRKRDLIVLPGEIVDGEQNVADEMIKGPVAMSPEFKHAGAQLAATGDGRGFSQVDLGVVGTLKMRMPV